MLSSGAAIVLRSGFASPVVPGILLASLFPAIIGSKCPGAVYLSQTLKFRAPALVRCLLRFTGCAVHVLWR
jgi:acyl dehydratase